jgi:hypothetical protein
VLAVAVEVAVVVEEVVVGAVEEVVAGVDVEGVETNDYSRHCGVSHF